MKMKKGQVGLSDQQTPWSMKPNLTPFTSETAKPNVADAVSVKEVNSDPRAACEKEENLQISRCALLPWRP
jgi:hypothetical protein